MAITWVIKASKLCNLRCSYCYEYGSLSDRSRISLENFGAIYALMQQVSARFGQRYKICWHGGEPTALPYEYLKTLLILQNDLAVKPTANIVQTNLARLDDAALSKINLFSHVSVSLDPLSPLRRFSNGRDSTDVVLSNMQKLTDLGVSFGVVSVLTRENLGDIDLLFDFFNRAKLDFRLLPFYRSHDNSQVDRFAIEPSEVATAMCRLIDQWFTSGSGIRVHPVMNYIEAAIDLALGSVAPRYVYDKAEGERVFIVDTDGSIFAVADTYDPRFCYGNAFTDNVDQVVGSIGRQRAVDESIYRMRESCGQCEYLGSCSGYAVGEATPLERPKLPDSSKCAIARPCIEHALGWLARSSIPQFGRARGGRELVNVTRGTGE